MLLTVLPTAKIIQHQWQMYEGEQKMNAMILTAKNRSTHK